TFETYFLADPATHEERKNAYFKLLNGAAFCGRVLAELGVDPERGYIINGHEAVVAHGDDIVPTVSDVEVYDRPRTVGETEAGEDLRAEIAALEELVR